MSGSCPLAVSADCIRLNPSISACIRLYSFLSACIHLYSLTVSVCFRLFPPVFTCIRRYPSVSACIRLYPLVSVYRRCGVPRCPLSSVYESETTVGVSLHWSVMDSGRPVVNQAPTPDTTGLRPRRQTDTTLQYSGQRTEIPLPPPPPRRRTRRGYDLGDRLHVLAALETGRGSL